MNHTQNEMALAHEVAILRQNYSALEARYRKLLKCYGKLHEEKKMLEKKRYA